MDHLVHRHVQLAIEAAIIRGGEFSIWPWIYDFPDELLARYLDLHRRIG